MKGDRDEAQRDGEKSTCSLPTSTDLSRNISQSWIRRATGSASVRVPVNKDGGKMNGDEKSIAQRSRLNNREERRGDGNGRKERDHMLPSLPLLLGRGTFWGSKILSKNSHVRLLPAPARVRPRRRRSLVSGRRTVRWRARRQTETGEQGEQRAD